VGFVCGENRAFEFGSEPCGWIFAVAVHPSHTRQGIASSLVGEACRRLRAAGVSRVRTMVRRNDLPLLSFFRASGFEGGSFVQLELDLDAEVP
jgi:ribosomal protein S18 acetylase RimI-like enzyme